MLLFSQDRSLQVPMRGLDAIVLPFLPSSGCALACTMMPPVVAGCELRRIFLPGTSVNKGRADSPSRIRLAGIISCNLRCSTNGSTTLSMWHTGGVMTANNSPSRTLGWLAIATGGVILIGDVSLMLFFTIGGFFGTFNDLCVAFAAILSALLSLILYPAHRAYSP